MTKGELIVACLKVMFDNDTEQLDPTNISDNPEYTSRTASIIEALNRGFDEIAKAKKLPKKTLYLTKDMGVLEGSLLRFDLSLLANDVLYISNIAYDNGWNYNPNVDIQLEGENTLVLFNIVEGKYIVTYHPRFTNQLSYDDSDSKVIEGIPDEALRVIPYFVKAELYEDDNMDKANYARNLFHQYLNELPKTPILKQNKVKSVFRGW